MTHPRLAWPPTRVWIPFSNACFRRESHTTFEWAPTAEKRSGVAIALCLAAVLSPFVLYDAFKQLDRQTALMIVLLPFVVILVWLATYATRVRVEVSDRSIRVARLWSSTHHLLEHIEAIDLDGRQHVVIRLRGGQRGDLRLHRLPVEAREAIVDEVLGRLEAHAMPTYRTVAEALPPLRIGPVEQESPPVSSAAWAARHG